MPFQSTQDDKITLDSLHILTEDSKLREASTSMLEKTVKRPKIP